MIPTPIQIANGLIGIHHHDEITGRKFYYEDELLPLLKEWGVPEPDWAGNAKELEKMHELIMAAIMNMHPSTVIKQLMEARSMNEKQLAAALGLTVKGTVRILDYGGAYSASTAAKLEEVFGVPAAKWLKIQDRYLDEFDRMFGQAKTTGDATNQ